MKSDDLLFFNLDRYIAFGVWLCYDTTSENGKDVWNMYSVLVVDDEIWIRKGIVRMIDCQRSQIHVIYEAGSVQEALSVYDEKHPDIVLADICFPDANGCALGEAIYQRDRRTRIVLISAHSDFIYAQRALKFRASNYLLKPVSKEQLNKTLEDCVRELEAMNVRPVMVEETQIHQNFSDEVVKKIIMELDQDCTQKISLAKLSETYHISETYLSHVFKKYTGKTLTNYVAQIRIEKASQLIAMNKDNSDKLYTIAQRVGYDDYQYFVRVFKKVMGISPREFEEQFRQSRETGDEVHQKD